MAKKKSGPKKKARTAKSASKRSATELQKDLDKLDADILTAINRRADLAQGIAAAAPGDQKKVYDPRQDAQTIERAVVKNPGPLGDQSVHVVFRELVSGCRAVLEPTCVAYLGPEFTFSHLAALEQFGESAELLPVATIRTVFHEVERGQADFGVVPMENSTDGRVSDTLECFSQSALRICGEVPLRIHHCLMGIGQQDEIEVVHSKPQALSQCRNWLAEHMPTAVPRPVGSTAEAAVYARANPKMAAIGSEIAGANYDLKVFTRNVEDNPNNITRFAVIGPEPGDRTGNDKTALLLEIAHEPGALADTMVIFKRNRLNLTWIESFPISDCPGRYLFFIEFIGHQKELRSRRAIESAAKKSLRLEVLGSYAQMEPIG